MWKAVEVETWEAIQELHYFEVPLYSAVAVAVVLLAIKWHAQRGAAAVADAGAPPFSPSSIALQAAAAAAAGASVGAAAGAQASIQQAQVLHAMQMQAVAMQMQACLQATASLAAAGEGGNLPWGHNPHMMGMGMPGMIAPRKTSMPPSRDASREPTAMGRQSAMPRGSGARTSAKAPQRSAPPPAAAPARAAPPPAAAAAAPPPMAAPAAGGGMMSGMMGSMASGMAAGVGMSVASRAVDAVMGPRATELSMIIKVLKKVKRQGLPVQQFGMETRAIVAAMRVHDSDADLQEKACLALDRLCLNKHNMAEIESLGGIALVATCLNRHGEHTGVQEEGCAALYRFLTMQAPVSLFAGAKDQLAAQKAILESKMQRTRRNKMQLLHVRDLLAEVNTADRRHAALHTADMPPSKRPRLRRLDDSALA